MKKSKQLALPFNQLESAITTDLVVQGPSPLRSFVNTDELRTLGISRKDDELLNAIMELGSRYRDESATSPPTLTCPADVSQFSKVQFAKKPDARYLLILVGTKHHVNHAWLYDETPSVRTLLRRAVAKTAAAFFIARNELNCTSLTSEDRDFIDQLTDDSSIVGIDLLDYLIVDAVNYVSAREQGSL